MIEYLTGLGPLVAFGLISAALSTIAFWPYIKDTLSGRTTPQRASWLIWSVLGSISVCSQIYEGATHSLMFAVVQVSCTVIIFALSIRFGTGCFVNAADAMVLVAAAVGLVAWYLTSSSVYALAISISISALGGICTITKAYRQPDSETLSTWALSAVASVFAVLAVGRVDMVLMAYPLYLLGLGSAIVLAILTGRLRQGTAVAPGPSVVLMGADLSVEPVFKSNRAIPQTEPFQMVEPAPLPQGRRKGSEKFNIPRIRAGAKAKLRA